MRTHGELAGGRSATEDESTLGVCALPPAPRHTSPSRPYPRPGGTGRAAPRLVCRLLEGGEAREALDRFQNVENQKIQNIVPRDMQNFRILNEDTRLVLVQLTFLTEFRLTMMKIRVNTL